MSQAHRVQTLVDHRAEFVGFLVKRVGDRQLAEDLFQEAFARSLEKLDQIRSDESVVAWFYRSLRNAVVDHMRRRGAQGRALERLAVELGEPTATQPDMHAAVCACVTRLAVTLKPEYAEALLAIDVRGLPVHEFAAERGITSNNAAVRVFRARKALLGEVETICGGCAEGGGCGTHCTCAPAAT